MEKIIDILTERFSKDSLMALATVDEKGMPWVRTIDAIFVEDSFYTITYALSNKVIHINNNPKVAISGEWFSGHGLAENVGHIKLDKNKEIANKLRTAFASWYDNGHTNEEDPNTIILKIKVTDGILFKDGTRYEF
ncbi:MAG: pyridoxamine 5'-phosphate oxidase family protein [Bacilli bacterium]|nr:pyridoxamine 5'-phosphate oxidase family protein [Bacilli bacterium]